MIRDRIKKQRWPIAASLLAHSLIIGLVLISAFEPSKTEESIYVTIVGNNPDSLEKDGSAEPPAYGANKQPRTQLIPPDRKYTETKKPQPSVKKQADDASPQSDQTEQAEPPAASDKAQAAFDQSDLTDIQTPEVGEQPAGSGSGTNFKELGSVIHEPDHGTGQDLNGSSEMKLFYQEVKSRLEKAKRYPWLARFNRQEGAVRLQFTISSFGEAKNISLIEPSRWRLLNDEAVAVIKRVPRFPQPPNNTDIEVVIPMVFRLSVRENSE
jgi:TonB family protein